MARLSICVWDHTCQPLAKSRCSLCVCVSELERGGVSSVCMEGADVCVWGVCVCMAGWGTGCGCVYVRGRGCECVLLVCLCTVNLGMYV